MSLASRAGAQPPLATVETDCASEVEAALAPRTSRTSPIPDRGVVADLGERACFAILEGQGVEFSRLATEDAGGVGMPIRLEGTLNGLRVASRGHVELHEILDCRLAVALLRWAPALRDAGVVSLIHYSTYRPGARVHGTGPISGHAGALAIDLAVVGFEDGTELDVLTGWESRDRGASPCEGDHGESERSALLRRLVCSTIDLFQIVLTPHYDAAHANHVHLELRPNVTWTYVR